VVDAIIALTVALALLWGLSRGLVQPLISELSFVIAVVIATRFHSQIEKVLPSAIPSWAASTVIVMGLTFGIGFASRPLVGILRSIPFIGSIDRTAGAVVHGVLAFVLVYLAIGALLDFDSKVYPMLRSGQVTAAQVRDYRRLVEQNPLAGSAADKQKLAQAEADAQKQPIPLSSFQQLEGFLNFYVHDIREPMTQSRLAPIVNNIGGRLPVIGHPRPYLGDTGRQARRGGGTLGLAI
jgi:uncharacterized membrane protein required for colicin V production